MEPRISNLLRRYTGLAASLAALTFVGYVTYAQRAWEANVAWGAVVGVSLLAVVGYAACCQLSAWSWTLLLRSLGGKEVGTWPGCRIFAQTNAAKYMPRRMFHYSSRQVLARRAGAPQASLVNSLLAEAFLTLGAAFLWAVPFAVYLFRAIGAHGSFYAASVLVLFAGIGGFAGWFLYRSNLIGGIRDSSPGGTWIVRLMLAAFVANILYFAIWGALTMLIADQVAGAAVLRISMVQIVAVTALSWAVGYVVPGTVAGLGLRDAALIALLAQFMTPQQAVIVALLSRLVTAAGDGLFFAAYWLAGKRISVLRLST